MEAIVEAIVEAAGETTPWGAEPAPAEARMRREAAAETRSATATKPTTAAMTLECLC